MSLASCVSLWQISKMQKNDQLIAIATYFLSLFKIDGKPANEVLSQGQFDVFYAICFKVNPRIACLAPTGYGKSEAVAMGVIIRAIIFNDEFIVASVKYGTSDIIMRKIIGHLFDSFVFTSQLELDTREKYDRLKRERTADKLTFFGGGSIKIISLYGAATDIGAAIGEHKPNIVLDESPLLTPSKYLQLKKILEGTGNYDTTFLFELGNAVNRNHFRQNVLFNSSYLKINISLEQAVAEGRLDMRSVEENRGLPLFNEFYLCQFPEEDEIDAKGYRTLITDQIIADRQKDQLFVPPKDGEPKVELRLGVDIGGGGDLSTFVMRSPTFAWVETFNQSHDTMTNVSEVIRIMEKYNLEPESVSIDDIGVGRGVSDRLKEMGHNVNGVAIGMPSEDKGRYFNLKAQYYWACKQWLENVGYLQKFDKWIQLNWVKFKVNTDKVVAIEPKADQKKRTGKSPDFADALMLTFAQAKQPSLRVL